MGEHSVTLLAAEEGGGTSNFLIPNGTFFFVLIIMGATDKLSAPGFAGLAIGLALTLIHLVSIPVTNTSVNPARSTGPALMVGDWAIGQLWMFWVAPILGGVLGGVAYRWMGKGG